MNEINLDEKIDYRLAYGGVIQKAKVQGDKLVGLCPFHDDRNASFSVNLKKGLYKCFACGEEGNYIDFVAKLRGISTKEAYKAILAENNLAQEDHKGPKSVKYTLAMYAAEKHLPIEWLKNLGLGEGVDKDGTGFVRIPYYDNTGKEVTFRKRYPKTARSRFKWKAGSAGKLLMYGEEALGEIRQAGYVFVVEGESDTQTLRFLGLPVLGVPGASNFKAEWAAKLVGVNIYLHIEPDVGGETFLTQMSAKLKDGGFSGEVYRWSCAEFGFKDPSELFIAKGAAESAELIKAAKRDAVKIDIYSEEIPEAVEGEPVHLRQPEGWRLTEEGIKRVDEKTMQYRIVCRTPLMLKRRLRSLETGDEKIEIAFKRDGEWQSAIFQRSTIFQSKSVTCLSDLGCTVTSENAKQIVSFLAAQEAANIDILEAADSTGVFGWQGKGRFLPYLGDDIVLDIEPSLRGWAAAYHQSGSLREWTEMVRPHRERDIFRFILAASFAAPLLKIVKQRNFMIYNWADSKGGKTAMLKCALSVWGEPERLMANFNATKVALERMASFYCDLPLGIDERQLAGDKQDYLENIVYMLGNGVGRARGSKGGGLQALNTWRSIILATGEEPITGENSQTGISTRILEIYGAPFAEEMAAAKIHQLTGFNYGLAGEVFIKKVIGLGEETVRSEYLEFFEAVQALAEGKNGAHIAAIAVVALADAYAEQWFFGAEKRAAVDRALVMAEAILRADAENADRDVNLNAAQFLQDWIMSHSTDFTNLARGARLGILEDDKAYVFQSALNDALRGAGYNPRKTAKFLADKDVYGWSMDEGKLKYSVLKKFDGKPVRFVEIDLERLRKLLKNEVRYEFLEVKDAENPFESKLF